MCVRFRVVLHVVSDDRPTCAAPLASPGATRSAPHRSPDTSPVQDPARLLGRFLAIAIYRVVIGPPPKPRAPDAPEDEEIDDIERSIRACLERFWSPAVLFDPITKHAVADADRLLAVTPVDTKALDGDIDSVRARLQLLEKRGLDHLPEYAYLRTKCDALTSQWRASCHAQGEATSVAPVPSPAPMPPPAAELSAVRALFR